ncbi:MAG: AAA family ATPase [Termitinemataceae bacterium]|nr:MAG: AAA family ATPase [Termitinemataceae bacterium]
MKKNDPVTISHITKDFGKIKIAISGKSGCGNTTVSRLLAEKLGLRFINFTFRNLAAERNIKLEEILEKAKTDDSWDKEVDKRQVAIANEDVNCGCVLGSRLAIWMLKNADLKIYLEAKPSVRVKRILAREGGTLEDVTAFTAERDRQDSDRYMHLYNIDNNDYSFADMIIDAETNTPSEITDIILERL